MRLAVRRRARHARSLGHRVGKRLAFRAIQVAQIVLNLREAEVRARLTHSQINRLRRRIRQLTVARDAHAQRVTRHELPVLYRLRAVQRPLPARRVRVRELHLAVVAVRLLYDQLPGLVVRHRHRHRVRLAVRRRACHARRLSHRVGERLAVLAVQVAQVIRHLRKAEVCRRLARCQRHLHRRRRRQLTVARDRHAQRVAFHKLAVLNGLRTIQFQLARRCIRVLKLRRLDQCAARIGNQVALPVVLHHDRYRLVRAVVRDAVDRLALVRLAHGPLVRASFSERHFAEAVNIFGNRIIAFTGRDGIFLSDLHSARIKRRRVTHRRDRELKLIVRRPVAPVQRLLYLDFAFAARRIRIIKLDGLYTVFLALNLDRLGDSQSAAGGILSDINGYLIDRLVQGIAIAVLAGLLNLIDIGMSSIVLVIVQPREGDGLAVVVDGHLVGRIAITVLLLERRSVLAGQREGKLLVPAGCRIAIDLLHSLDQLTAGSGILIIKADARAHLLGFVVPGDGADLRNRPAVDLRLLALVIRDSKEMLRISDLIILHIL